MRHFNSGVNGSRPRRAGIALALAACFAAAAVQAHGGDDGMQAAHAQHMMAMNHSMQGRMDMGNMDHMQHMQHMQQAREAEVKRTTVDYKLPSVNLVRDDGKPVSLDKELNDGRPVFLTFIYTTCNTICPVASQTFSQLEKALGSERDKVHLVSISIDPEQDTPAQLREYAKRFGAGPEWSLYTGTVAASISAQQAFDVYRGDKMNHNPVTFVRAAPGQPWLRIDGFTTASELLSDYRRLAAS